jgi:hypothetical protein
MKALNIALASVFSVGCAQTQFQGDPHISAQQCQAACAQRQLQMSGMVFMGEYSSACICEVPRPQGAPPPSGAAGAAGGAAAGVVMQMRRANQHHQQ